MGLDTHISYNNEFLTPQMDVIFIVIFLNDIMQMIQTYSLRLYNIVTCLMICMMLCIIYHVNLRSTACSLFIVYHVCVLYL